MHKTTLFAICVVLCTLIQTHSALRSSNVTLTRRDIVDKTARLGQEKKDIVQFLNTKNVIKTMLKLLFGSNEESVATSRQVLNVFVKVRHLINDFFCQSK